MLKNIFNRKKQESNLPEPDYEQPENAENSIEADEPKPLSEQINDVNVEAGLPLDSSGGKNNMVKVAVLAVALVGVGIAVAGMIAFSSGGDDDEAVAVQQQELERIQKPKPKIFLLKNLILDKKKMPHQNLWRHYRLELPKRKLYHRLKPPKHRNLRSLKPHKLPNLKKHHATANYAALC